MQQPTSPLRTYVPDTPLVSTTPTMAIGKISPFNASTDDFDSWVSVLTSFFTANGITQTSSEEKIKVVAIFLSSVGISSFTVLKDLCAPAQPSDKTFDELVSLLKAHYKPAPQALAERFKFHLRKQQTGESVNAFLADLRHKAITCEFEKLDTSLRDQLIFGLQSEAAQKRLFLEDHTKLTLAQAVAIAVSQEQADSSTHLVRGGTHSNPTGTQDNFKLSKYKARKQSKPSNGQSQKCSNCGGGHSWKECSHKDAECFSCGKKGHFSKFCRSSGQKKSKFPPRKPVHSVNRISGDGCITLEVEINGKPHQMELDTASGSSFISTAFWRSLGSPHLQKSNITFKTYTGESFGSKGELTCSVTHNEQTHNCTLQVSSGISLFGRDLLNLFQMDWQQIKRQCGNGGRPVNQVKHQDLKTLLQEFKDVFDGPVGKISNFKARIHVKDDAVPKFFKARPVPFALKAKVDQELEHMERNGILTKLEHSEWASPLVVVPKPSGKVRITGDFKCTLNNQLCVKQYPLTRVDDLLEKIGGGQLFTKLDATDAYHQVEIEESCKKFLVINTHRGLYQYNVLPQGVASSPAIFQELVDRMLKDIPMTGSFIDDVICSGKSDVDHLKHLRLILQRMRDFNYRLTRSKCIFMMPQVQFLGHLVCSDGLRTDPSKVEAIQDMPTPKNADDVKSFLGLVNFYSKFLPNLSDVADPLYHLTRKDVVWKWTPDCYQAFRRIKKLVSSSAVLAHYQQSLPVGIACDASSVGLGVVLFHVCPDGTERPVAYASKTLSSSERNYSQIEKEGLSIIFGVKKFLPFLFGTPFRLITDHAPLLAIFGEKKDLPALVATRLHRWALFLSGFQYQISYRNTLKHGNADCLSRLPIPDSSTVDPVSEIEVHAITQDHPISSSLVKLRTSRDPVLSQVMRFTQQGWPSQVAENLRPYHQHHTELWINNGIIMWGVRVVIPTSLTQEILQQLHATHPGVVRMKSIARSYVWWPGIDAEIEKTVRICPHCVQNRDNPATAPLHPWSYPEQPWQRLHMDLAGPFLNNMWLIIVDAHSKWPEVFKLGNDSTSGKVIRYVRECISRFGLPDTIVTDNGPQFVSSEFKDFCKSNGIRHSTSSAYHPRSNGEAERFVKTFKNAMRTPTRSVDAVLSEFLLTYRGTPHTTTGTPPAELLFKKRPKTLLDLLRPDVDRTVRTKQDKQTEQFNNAKDGRQFLPNRLVWVQTLSKNQPKWSQGIILQPVGPVSYKVRVGDRVIKRHIDHLLSAEVILPTPSIQPQDEKPTLPVQEAVTMPATPPPGSPEAFTSLPGSPILAAPGLIPPLAQPSAPPLADVGVEEDMELDRSIGRDRERRVIQPPNFYIPQFFGRKAKK